MADKPTYEELEQRVRELEKENIDRKQAKEMLRESEDRFSKAFHHSPLLMTISDMEDGTYLDINDKFSEVSGFSREEAIGKTSIELGWISQEDRKRLKEAMETRGHISGMEFTLIKKDKQESHCLYYGELITIDDRKRLLSIASDITERKQAEEALLKSEENLSTTLDSIADAVIATDRDGRIARMNPVAEKLTGWKLSDAEGRHVNEVFEIVNEESRKAVESPVDRVLREGVVVGLANHTLLISKDGTEWAIDDSGAPIRNAQGDVTGAVLVFRDLTEQRLAERRITHLNAVLRAIRNVNQLIVREKDRGRLIQNACEALVETRGYYSAWIVLVDESHRVLTSAEAGLGDKLSLISERLEQGRLTHCCERAQRQQGIVAIEDPLSGCVECPVSHTYSGRGAMAMPLEYGRKVYGFWVVSIPSDFATDKNEHALFEEVANDIAFALHAIELEEERRRMEEALQQRTQHLGERVKELNCLYGISELVDKADISLNEILSGTVGLIPESWQYPEITCGRIILEGQEFATDNFQETTWKQTTDIIAYGEPIGSVEVYYLEKKPGIDKGLFMKKERRLIKAIAERLGRIIERKRAEHALRESKQEYRTLIETTSEGFWLIDGERKTLEVNQSLCNMLGYSREEIIGKTPLYFVDDENRKIFKSQMGKIKDTPHRTYEITLKSKTGEDVYTHFSATTIFDETGAVRGAFALITDITERKLAEEEKKKLEAQLHQAERMEAIGTLAGGIAHDFNNILAAIMGFAELAKADMPEDSQAEANLNEVLTAGKRARDLVKQMLTFSRQSEAEQKPLEINSVVIEALKLLRASIPTTIEIRKDITKESATVMADPTQIHQVLMNLCTNAAFAMKKDGGILGIGLENIDIEGDATAQYPDIKPGPYVRLFVSDTGPGIEGAVKGRIFDPFFTTKGPGEGTGMGLSVVHGIVKSHGGVITVYSEPGEGTTFHVLLPGIEGEIAAEAEKVEPLSTGTERILFVDDEEALVRMGEQMLSRLGYEVVARTSSVEALEAFRTQPGRFDLVITDLTMPNMTGKQLARELAGIRSDIPIILCTGYSQIMSDEKAKSIGIDGVVMKPMVMRELAETIRRVLDKN